MQTLFYANPYTWFDAVNAFFLYSFFGWCMECVVIRREKGFWENRGFTHAPFCIIYGFGAMLGYAILKPFSGNYLVLYLVGAVLATGFEYLTARLMLKAFGNLWWDYSRKPLNYKGILCLESTIGWGVISVLLFTVLHKFVFGLVQQIHPRFGVPLAVLLICGYALDFAFSARSAYVNRAEKNAETAELQS